MNLFSHLFPGSTSDTPSLSWTSLNQEGQLKGILKESYDQPIIIFKHSIRCGISAMVKHQLEHEWDFSPSDIKAYYLDLIQYRSISNEIASKLGVPHQSPQLILLIKGTVAYHASHHAINLRQLRQAVFDTQRSDLNHS